MPLLFIPTHISNSLSVKIYIIYWFAFNLQFFIDNLQPSMTTNPNREQQLPVIFTYPPEKKEPLNPASV